MSKLNRWKQLERDTGDHFDLLLKKLAEENNIPYKHLLSRYDKLVERNRRGDDFSQEDSDVDIIVPGLHHLIGGPFIAESKYRQKNPLGKMFNDFAKTRASSFLTPIMIISHKGVHYVARWLADFKHKDWMRDLEWGDVWLISKKLNKKNKYLEEWFEQAEDYSDDKIASYDLSRDEITPLVVTRGLRQKAIVIQKIPPSDEFGDK